MQVFLSDEIRKAATVLSVFGPLQLLLRFF
jgi:hypothetical protein